MNNRKWMAFIVILILAFLTFLFASNPAFTMQKQHIDNAFIDVNGDGRVDFLVSGDVIINDGTTNFLFQPTNSQP